MAPTPDYAQEPHRAIGHAPVNRNLRDARSVDDLPGSVLPRLRGGQLLDDADPPRRRVGLDAEVRDDRVPQVHRRVSSYPRLGCSTYLFGAFGSSA